jgi:hypothetical protein
VRFRLATEHDLPTCRTLLHPGFRASPAVRDQMVRLWTELLAIRPGTFGVIESPARPHPDAIEAFGFSVFVTDRFAEAICGCPRPYLAALIYEDMLGGRSPVLSQGEIRDANASDGLNLAVLHFGLRDPDMTKERTQRALQAGIAAFCFFHGGYRLKVLLQEVYGQQQAEYVCAGGGRVFAGFDGGAGAGVPTGIPPEHRPFLFVQRREWLTRAAVSPLSSLFHTPRPQLGFSAAEQHVLVRALLNESDVEIAKALGVPLDAVKKTWRRTYERMATAIPYLLDRPERAEVANHRGREKRRHLLEYLRNHLEELRPYSEAETQDL